MLEPEPAFGQVKFSRPPYCYAALVPHCVLVEILKKNRKIKELTFFKHFTPQPRSHKRSINYLPHLKLDNFITAVGSWAVDCSLKTISFVGNKIYQKGSDKIILFRTD